MIYKICNRCVMDTTIKVINFDENGICNYCKNYDYRVATEVYKEPERSRRLNILIDKIKKDGQKKKYDCIIGVSGGVDSTYVAYLVKKFGLRPLAIHLDNGWNSELAVQNIQNLLNKLNIDFYTHVIDWEEFKDLQKAFIKSSIENLEIPSDHAINALLFKTADEYGLKYIINGSNLATEGLFSNTAGGLDIDYRLLKDIHKKFGTKKLKTYPSIDIWNLVYKIIVKKIKYIPILNYIDYNKEKVIELLEKEFGWKRYGGKHHESIFTRFFQGYILLNKNNYDKRKDHFSNLIMSGQISRGDALHELSKHPYPNQELLKEDIKFFLKKFNYTKLEFETIMMTKPRKPSDFKSYEGIFKKLKPLVLKIKEYAKKINYEKC
jgi:N-acetyl sugar amidotransferase